MEKNFNVHGITSGKYYILSYNFSAGLSSIIQKKKKKRDETKNRGKCFGKMTSSHFFGYILGLALLNLPRFHPLFHRKYLFLF